MLQFQPHCHPFFSMAQKQTPLCNRVCNSHHSWRVMFPSFNSYHLCWQNSWHNFTTSQKYGIGVRSDKALIGCLNTAHALLINSSSLYYTNEADLSLSFSEYIQLLTKIKVVISTLLLNTRISVHATIDLLQRGWMDGWMDGWMGGREGLNEG